MARAPVAAPRGTLSRLGGGLLDLAFPRRCVRCSAMGRFICAECAAGMMTADGQRCSVCWIGGADDRCSRCAYFPPKFRAVRSAFVYDSELVPVFEHDGAVRAAIHALKYRGLSSLAPEMAHSMTQLLADWNPAVDVIVPVPLFGMRKRLRGYNQSELLAREIGRAAGLPVDNESLMRTRQTPPQVKQVGYEARMQNMQSAFAVRGQALEGRGVLLVDDVMTTGATLDACARVLLHAGTGPVFALTYARED